MALPVAILPVAIETPELSFYDSIEDDGFRDLLDHLHGKVAEAANWKVRKKVFLDLIRGLYLLHHVELGAGESEGQEETARLFHDEDHDRRFIGNLPFFVAAILEKLDEKEIACVEQAAFYLISAHLEHQGAADRWLGDDYKRLKQFKKFLRDNRYYAAIAELGAAMFGPAIDMAPDLSGEAPYSLRIGSP
jgi:hypothetical protein